ncbi:TPR-like protein, partial [Neoconidiobolus thromboides FSU 785]
MVGFNTDSLKKVISGLKKGFNINKKFGLVKTNEVLKDMASELNHYCKYRETQEKEAKFGNKILKIDGEIKSETEPINIIEEDKVKIERGLGRLKLKFYSIEDGTEESWVKSYKGIFEKQLATEKAVSRIIDKFENGDHQSIVSELKKNYFSNPVLYYYYILSRIELKTHKIWTGVKVLEANNENLQIDYFKIYREEFNELMEHENEIIDTSDDLNEGNKIINHPFVLYLFGMIANKLRRHDLASKLLLLSIQRYPLNWDAWLELSISIKNETEYYHCLPNLPNVFIKHLFIMIMANNLSLSNEQDKESCQLLYETIYYSDCYIIYRALAHYKNCDYEYSKLEFQRYYEKNKYSLDYAEIYSHILIYTDDSVGLQNFAARCRRLREDSYESMCVNGNFLSYSNSASKATKLFTDAIKISPASTQALFYLANHYLKLNLISSATKTLETLLILSPDDYRALQGLSLIYLTQKNYFAAEAMLIKLVSIRPNNLNGWTYLAQVSESIKDYSTAIKSYLKLKEHNNSREINLKLGSIYQKYSQNMRDNFSKMAACYFFQGIDFNHIEELNENQKFAVSHLLYYSVAVKDFQAAADYWTILDKCSDYFSPKLLALIRCLPMELGGVLDEKNRDLKRKNEELENEEGTERENMDTKRQK